MKGHRNILPWQFHRMSSLSSENWQYRSPLHVSIQPSLNTHHLQYEMCVVHNSTWEWKTSKKKRPGSIHHMNDVWWTQGGHREVGAQNNALDHPFERSTTVLDSRPWHERNYLFWPVKKRTLKFSANTHIWVLAPPLPLRPPCIYLRDECSEAFFDLLSSIQAPVYYCEHKQKVETGEAWNKANSECTAVTQCYMCIKAVLYAYSSPGNWEKWSSGTGRWMV